MKKRAEMKAKRNPEPEPLGKPTLNEKSRKLAKDVATGKSHVDYLISKGREYEKRKQELAEEKERTLVEKETLTFTPNINSKGSSSARRGDTFEHLY